MFGCGETPEHVVKSMEKVRAAGVDVITFGQYMRPSKHHMPVSEYVTPEAFEKYKVIGDEMGFRYVASGPMVRSSYKAGEFYIKNMIERDKSCSSPTEILCCLIEWIECCYCNARSGTFASINVETRTQCGW